MGYSGRRGHFHYQNHRRCHIISFENMGHSQCHRRALESPAWRIWPQLATFLSLIWSLWFPRELGIWTHLEATIGFCPVNSPHFPLSPYHTYWALTLDDLRWHRRRTQSIMSELKTTKRLCPPWPLLEHGPRVPNHLICRILPGKSLSLSPESFRQNTIARHLCCVSTEREISLMLITPTLCGLSLSWRRMTRINRWFITR